MVEDIEVAEELTTCQQGPERGRCHLGYIVPRRRTTHSQGVSAADRSTVHNHSFSHGALSSSPSRASATLPPAFHAPYEGSLLA